MSKTPNEQAKTDEADGVDLGADDAAAEVAHDVNPTESNEVIKLKTERDQLFERLARTQAEYQNSRKRLEADMESRLSYANSGLIKSLLPVIDNFERALAVDPEKADVATVLRGLQLVHDQWISVLKKENVEEIAPKPGDAFNVTGGMEAVMQQDAPPELAGKGQVVTQTFAKGYKLRDRVLRPAQVAVSKG